MDAQPPTTVWSALSPSQGRFAIFCLVVAVAQFVAVDLYFRFQQLSSINAYLSGATAEVPGDGITYTPMVLSMVAYAALVAAPVIQTTSQVRSGRRSDLFLGSAWMLVSTALIFDYLVDSFEPKLAVAVLFLFAGVIYWRRSTDNPYAFVLAPMVALVAAADGLTHVSGSFCTSSGLLDSCPAKAISDGYLLMLLITLTYFTIVLRATRPTLRLILAAVIIPVVAFVALGAIP